MASRSTPDSCSTPTKPRRQDTGLASQLTCKLEKRPLAYFLRYQSILMLIAPQEEHKFPCRRRCEVDPTSQRDPQRASWKKHF